MPSNTKVRISVTIHPNLDNMLQKSIEKSGSSKSALVEQALTSYFKKSFVKDIKLLAKMKFEDLPSEDDWLEIQSKI